MKSWEKEILQAILDLEKETAKKLLEAYKKALQKTSYAIRLLALSDIMEKLNQEQPGGMPGYMLVYQKQYEKEISKTIAEPLEELEAAEKEIVNESIWKYFLLGALATMYGLHKQKIPLVIPVQPSKGPGSAKTNTGYSITFTGPKTPEWYKYIRRDIEDLKVKTVADVRRQIAAGKPYNEIARSMANNMSNSMPGTSFKKAYNKAMTVIRTEGGRINNEAQYRAMVEAKKAGADIKKQWCATLDSRTRHSHARLDGEIREVEEKFSNGLLYPCQRGGAAEEVINCRCVAMSRATWGLDSSELDTLKERAAYYGLDKTKSFNDFKETYLKASSKA